LLPRQRNLAEDGRLPCEEREEKSKGTPGKGAYHQTQKKGQAVRRRSCRKGENTRKKNTLKEPTISGRPWALLKRPFPKGGRTLSEKGRGIIPSGKLFHFTIDPPTRLTSINSRKKGNIKNSFHLGGGMAPSRIVIARGRGGAGKRENRHPEKLNIQ